MPASEETFRDQRRLHVVFGISSIAMFLTIGWMILADHLRSWKDYQREFHRIEDAKLRVEERQKNEQLNKARVEQLDEQLRAAEQRASENARDVRAKEKELDRLTGQFDLLDTAARFKKAELDSKRSLYDGMIDLAENRKAREYVASDIRPAEAELTEIRRQLETVEASKKTAEIELAKLRGDVEPIEKEKNGLTRERDRVERLLKQKDAQYFGLVAWARGLPFLDLAAPPTKIQQLSLPDLTINYNFKHVPRYDRCQTCHLAIDRINYDVDAEGKRLVQPFASHPLVSRGAMVTDLKGNRVEAGLYLDSNGPHGMNKFGCTICHGGQGSGTDFTYASHTPNDLGQEEEWVNHRGWREVHHWDEPMHMKRFMESSCLKCHHQVTDIPEASKLQAGYQRIVKYGCTGCHTIGGEGSFGPDLTDERQVGPSLRHLGSKASKDWTSKWIRNPHAFRPDTRMPRFYEVTNNSSPADQGRNNAEVHAITHYLFAKSVPSAGFVEPAAKGSTDPNRPPAQADTDADRGKEQFFAKGCMACHAHKDFPPTSFPESVQAYAKADHGPNLSEVAAKFQSSAQGYHWLVNWVKTPEAYHPKAMMPNLQLSWKDAADIASWILSIKGEWPREVHLPAVDSPEVKKGIDDLLLLYKGKMMPLSRAEREVAEMKLDDKLMFLGERTIGRLGCFGCHDIAGFESYKPIGTPLNDWGIKNPAKLDFGHIAEYIDDAKLDENGDRDGTHPFFQQQLGHHNRIGFLYQKLHRPRSYDYKKTGDDLKAWDDRLRMPQFVWADDPKAVEEVMTFILGLTGEKIGPSYLPKYSYSAAKKAVAEGEKLLNRFNCEGCHTLEMPKYTAMEGMKFEEAFTDFETNVRVANNNRASDYLAAFYPQIKHDPKADPVAALTPPDPKHVTIEGMPVQTFENDLTVQLWRAVTIRGFTFNVGDTLTLDKRKVHVTPAKGGNFAWLFATAQADRTGTDFATFWNRLPPPLLREGAKVQTPWLREFLKDPYSIRPAVNLRMPRFHYGKTPELAAHESEAIANYFAAVEGQEFPYQAIPQREQAYLAGMESKHADYLGGGWQLMTKGACIQCHNVGPFKPTGGAQVVNGPDLRQVSNRFRPEYLAEWLGKPSRLLPFTAMPQNIIPAGPAAPGVPKSMEGNPLAQVISVRDTLLNYTTAVEQQLATAKPPTPAAPAPAAPRQGGGQ